MMMIGAVIDAENRGSGQVNHNHSPEHWTHHRTTGPLHYVQAAAPPAQYTAHLHRH